MHASQPKLLEQYNKTLPILRLNALHFRLILEFINNEKEKTLGEILNDEMYEPIRSAYNLELKDVVISSVILEHSLNYMIRNLYVELHKVLHDLNTPKPPVKIEDAAVDIQIIVRCKNIILLIP